MHEPATTALACGGVFGRPIRLTRARPDRLCLPPVEPLRPEEINHSREALRMIQAVFAALLNTSVSTVQKWEIGQKRPTGTALKLLHLVQERGLEAVA